MDPIVNTEAKAKLLVRHLFSKNRTTPTIVVTWNTERTGPVMSCFEFQEILGDLAKVFLVTGGTLRCFNKLLDNTYGIHPSGVRMYVPRMTQNDVPPRHPVWNQYRIFKEYVSPQEFMHTVRKLCEGRIAYQNSHSHMTKLLNAEEADALLQEAVIPSKELTSPIRPRNRPPQSGRRILSLKVTHEEICDLSQADPEYVPPSRLRHRDRRWSR
jgi:hypothetical protein